LKVVKHELIIKHIIIIIIGVDLMIIN